MIETTQLETPLTQTVAVYGTLRRFTRGLSHTVHGRHKGLGTLIGDYVILVKGLPYLYDRLDGITPCDIAPLIKPNSVVVDVYEVSDNELKRLDALEGHPKWYMRKEVTVQVAGHQFKAWSYFGPPVHPKIMRGYYPYEFTSNYLAAYGTRSTV